MTDNKHLEIAPFNPSGWEVVIKTGIGLVNGMIIAFLVFIMLILVGGMVSEALSNQIAGTVQINPLLPLILIVIAFVGTFVGSIILVGTYNLIYSDKYYDMSRMFALTLIINIILFLMFIGLYLLFAANINELFFVLALHILFTVFAAFTAIEMSTNPNYSAVHLIGASIGLAVAMLCFGGAYKIIDVNQGNNAAILLALPPVLAYCFLPLMHGLREKIYYKFYSVGNNFFYIPSLSEVLVDEDDFEEVEVDID